MALIKKLVLASGNQGKAREFAAILQPLGYQVILQSELKVPEAEENGKSFLENALLKARNASKFTGLPAIADDSGLAVDALKGAPGIYSARYCGRHGDDAANNAKLLQDLASFKLPAQRQARYWCALALVRHADDPVPLTALGSWSGRIGFAQRGHRGFGYDPLFEVNDRHCTAAELPEQIKNLISHRARALKHLLLEMQSHGF